MSANTANIASSSGGGGGRSRRSCAAYCNFHVSTMMTDSDDDNDSNQW